MYLDYINDLIDYYRAGEKRALLSQRLVRPTPASLKDECSHVLQTRFLAQDVGTLSAFFKVENDRDKISRAIERFDTDRFKPLVNFLRGATKQTEHLNIELLAWLVDFPGRPFHPGYRKKEAGAGVDGLVGDAKNLKLPGAEEELQLKDEKSGTSFVEQLVVLNNKAKRWGSGSMPVVKRKIVVCAAVLFACMLTGFFISGDNIPPMALGARASNPISPDYAKCTGASPCKACSNCSSCNWCNSGGSCGICAPAPKKKPTQKRSAQCKAITKKGTQCSRASKAGEEYCWQHLK